MSLFSIRIPGRPGIKKNSRRLFRSKNSRAIVNLPSVKFEDWNLVAMALIKHAWKGKTAIDTPLMIRLEFHFPNRHALPDTSNCIEGIQDALEDAGVIKNDKLIEIVVARRIVGGCSEAYTEVELKDASEVA